MEKILSLPIGSESGDEICVDVPIIDDMVVEETEVFVIHLLVHDLNVDVPMAYAYAQVQIIDDDGMSLNFLTLKSDNGSSLTFLCMALNVLIRCTYTCHV